MTTNDKQWITTVWKDSGGCGAQPIELAEIIPRWLLELIAGHVQAPSMPNSIARLDCPHIDWSAAYRRDPALFRRRPDLGAPGPEDLAAAAELLATVGRALRVHVEIETYLEGPAIVVYGAGLAGELGRATGIPDTLWPQVAALLTTCTSTVTIPLPPRALPPATAWPEWEPSVDGGTWWSYLGGRRPGCACPGCTAAAGLHSAFGPGTT